MKSLGAVKKTMSVPAIAFLATMSLYSGASLAGNFTETSDNITSVTVGSNGAGFLLLKNPSSTFKTNCVTLSLPTGSPAVWYSMIMAQYEGSGTVTIYYSTGAGGGCTVLDVTVP